MRFFRAVKFVLAAFLLLPAIPAAAQQICAQLEQQLVQLQRGGQNQSQLQQMQQQYAREEQNYNSLYAAAQGQGCIRVIQRLAPAQCAPLLEQVNRSAATLQQLASQLNAMQGGGMQAQINETLRALGNYNCGPQYAPYANNNQGGGLLDRLFGVDPGVGQPIFEINTYRTLCVRTCDGSYFPISFAATQSQFQSDALTCQAQCPGQQVELYVHVNPGEGIEEAVSLGGQAYEQLVNAFAFRESYNSTCSCRPLYEADTRTARFSPTTIDLSRSFQVTAEDADEPVATGPPIPRLRPEPSEDPDTVANREGRFTPGATVIPELEPRIAIVNTEGQRLIGPTYLYAQ